MTSSSWPYSTASPDSARLAPTMPSAGATTSWATPSMSTAPSRSPARTRVAGGEVRSAAGRCRRPARWRRSRVGSRARRAVEQRRPAGARPGAVAAVGRLASLAAVASGMASVAGRRRAATGLPRSAGAGGPASAPSRTSSSPRPVAPSLATRAGSSSSVRRSMAAWSAARSAALDGSAPPGSGAMTRRARARPPRGPVGRRATSPRCPRTDRATAGIEQVAEAVREAAVRALGHLRLGDLSVGAQGPVAPVALVDQLVDGQRLEGGQPVEDDRLEPAGGLLGVGVGARSRLGRRRCRRRRGRAGPRPTCASRRRPSRPRPGCATGSTRSPPG